MPHLFSMGHPAQDHSDTGCSIFCALLKKTFVRKTEQDVHDSPDSFLIVYFF